MVLKSYLLKREIATKDNSLRALFMAKENNFMQMESIMMDTS
jgi:hypothetical protein